MKNKKYRAGRTRLFLTENWIPDVETAIELLGCLASDNDPVSVKMDNGEYMNFDSGLHGFDCGGIVRMSTPHANCPSCECTLDIDTRKPSNKFMIRYYSMYNGMVEDSLFDMVLDRMGIKKG